MAVHKSLYTLFTSELVVTLYRGAILAGIPLTELRIQK